ncbi:MAG: M28 family peptidase [Fuerstiella sp.]|nr:M28 family peptidase [Fuerstiella sp.]MCP4853485.1 M28 family peptidase [Fuerstiella sp.]
MIKQIQIFLLLFSCGTTAISQDTAAPDLSEEAMAAMHAILEGRVLSTISFLASDEMAGRDTPSPELRIASQYVAARFRGAGLEGAGPGGSFFQIHQLVTTMPPEYGTAISVDGGDAISHRGLLSGGAEAIDLTATVVKESAALEADAAEVVCLDRLHLPPQAAERPQFVLASVARRIRALTDRKTKVVLIPCDDGNILPQVAERLLQKSLFLKDGLTPQCAVLLVPSDSNPVGKKLSIQIEAQREMQNPVRNVVGILRGSDPNLSQEAVLISAHLDHIGVRSHGDDRINNGADDNATGVTAVISLADAFASLKTKPRRSIVFVTFWGEEKGLLGSKHFAENPLWPLSKTVANINIEMVGRPEEDAREKAWMTGWKHSNLGLLMNSGAQRAGVEIFNRTDVGEMLYARSDNYSFVRKGVVAHSFSAGSLHADYHQPSDEWERLDIPHMTKVIRGLFAGALFVAENSVAPESSGN